MSESEGRGWQGIGAVVGMLSLVAAVTIGALAFDSGTPAAAAGLERFSSCAELESWTEDAQAPDEELVFGDDVAVEESGRAADGDSAGASGGGTATAPAAAPTTVTNDATDQATSLESSGGEGGDTGGTNTVVEGVDEIDIIDRIGDDRLLVSRNGSLALVDLTARTVVAEVGGVPYDARISVADGLVWVAGSSNDGLGTEVRRYRLAGDEITEDGSWTTPGYLLDARRTPEGLHVVAVDYPQAEAVPFDGGPVPCDQVWRPIDPATTPAATLVATLPAEGDLSPTAATEVTGAAGNILVTGDAVFLATETWTGDGDVTSGLHRFDLATLELTGSGGVPGTVAGPFALSEHEGNLRVATSAGGGFGRPLPVEGDVIVDDTDVASSAVATEAPGATAALAEVFVLDTEGDLDLVGSTGRFGHDGETIHGVRFVGDIAYVVTFLQTDPFWVIDLSDPSAPAIVGELEIPGFSGYLHPLGDGRVVGFGPDGQGGTAARLFDVTDPANPSVIDEIRLGDDSTVAYDHHAFVGLEGTRFAVPVTDYPDIVDDGRCIDQPIPVDPGIGDGSTGSGGTVTTVPPDAGGTEPGIEPPGIVPCEPVFAGGETGAVVLELVDGRLVEVERATVESTDAYAERVVLAPDGTWLLLSWDRLIATDDGSAIPLPVA